ncbi:MAG: MFS transporter [Acidobacteriota bacterium]
MRSKAPWIVVSLMIGLSTTSYIDRTIISIAGPHIIKEFGLSETQMGSIYSAFILSYALFMVPGGWLTDRFGPRLTLTAMGVGAALFTALTAAAGHPVVNQSLGILPSFLVIRLAYGVCTAPLYPACGKMTANWIPLRSRARAQGLILAGAPLGGAITPVLVAWLIACFGWRASFGLAAVVTILVTVGWFWYVRDRPYSPSDSPDAGESIEGNPGIAGQLDKKQAFPCLVLLRNRNLVLLAFSYFALNYFECIFFYWIYYYFGEIRHLGQSQSAIYTTGLLLTMMAMMPLGGWVSDRLIPFWGVKFSRQSVCVAGLVLSAILLFVGTNVTTPAAVVTLLSLSLGFAASSEAPFWASAIEAGRDHVGAAGGIMNGVGNLGSFVAPVLTPYIAKQAGWTWGLHSGSVAVLVAALAWFFIDPNQRRNHGVPIEV